MVAAATATTVAPDTHTHAHTQDTHTNGNTQPWFDAPVSSRLLNLLLPANCLLLVSPQRKRKGKKTEEDFRSCFDCFFFFFIRMCECSDRQLRL